MQRPCSSNQNVSSFVPASGACSFRLRLQRASKKVADRCDVIGRSGLSRTESPKDLEPRVGTPNCLRAEVFHFTGCGSWVKSFREWVFRFEVRRSSSSGYGTNYQIFSAFFEGPPTFRSEFRQDCPDVSLHLAKPQERAYPDVKLVLRVLLRCLAAGR